MKEFNVVSCLVYVRFIVFGAVFCNNIKINESLKMKLKQGAFSLKYNSSSQLNRSSLKDLSKEKNKENHSSNTLLHVSDIMNTLD